MPVRAQVLTLDVVFALFIVIATILFLAGFGQDYPELKSLAMERKATDAVLFLYEECYGGLQAGEMESRDLRRLLKGIEGNGVEVNVWGKSWFEGEKSGWKIEKSFIVADVNQTNWEVGKVAVWG